MKNPIKKFLAWVSVFYTSKDFIYIQIVIFMLLAWWVLGK